MFVYLFFIDIGPRVSSFNGKMDGKTQEMYIKNHPNLHKKLLKQ